MAVYKTYTIEDRNNRRIENVTGDKRTQVNTIVSNFITYFKEKHM